MNTSVKKLDAPVHLWAVIGPLFIIAIVLVVNIRAMTAHWSLSLAAIGGVFLCCRWGWRGCAAASTLLLGASFYQYFAFPAFGALWTSLLFLALAAAFVVTTLFLDEIKEVLDTLRQQSLQYAGERGDLEEKLLIAQNKLESERQLLTSRLELVKREVGEKEEKLLHTEGQLLAIEEKILDCDKLVALARQDILEGHARQEALLQELFDARQLAASFEKELGSIQDQSAFSQCTVHESLITEQKEKLALQDQEIKDLRVRLEVALEEEKWSRQQSENFVVELMNLREQQLVKDAKSYETQEAQGLHDAVVEELRTQIGLLTQEKQSLEMTLSQLQSEFEKFSWDLKEKTEAVEIQTAKIEMLQTAFEQSQEALKSETSHYAEFRKQAEGKERERQQLVEELMRKLSSATQQMIQWQQRVNDYHALMDRYAALQKQIQEHVGEKQLLVQQLEQAHKHVEQADMNAAMALSQEIALKHELQEMTSLYAKEQAANLVNVRLAADCNRFKDEAALLQQEVVSLQEEVKLSAVFAADCDRLKGEAALLQQEIVSLQYELRESTVFAADCERLKDEAALLQQQVASLQQEAKASAVFAADCDRLKGEAALLQQEMASLQQELKESTVFAADCERLKGEAALLQQEMASLQQELKESAVFAADCERLKDEAALLQQEMASLQQELKESAVFAADCDRLKGEAALLQQDVASLQQELKESTVFAADCNRLKGEIALLQQEVASLQEEVKLSAVFAADCKKLKEEMNKLEEELVIAKAAHATVAVKETPDAQTRPDAEASSDTITEEAALQHIQDLDRQLRRADGLYQQLRQQFQEKSKTLDDTRKELFAAQEKSLWLEKELQEKEVFGESEGESSLYQMLATTQAEANAKVANLESEITQLQELVGAFMQAP